MNTNKGRKITFRCSDLMYFNISALAGGRSISEYVRLCIQKAEDDHNERNVKGETAIVMEAYTGLNSLQRDLWITTQKVREKWATISKEGQDTIKKNLKAAGKYGTLTHENEKAFYAECAKVDK